MKQYSKGIYVKFKPEEVEMIYDRMKDHFPELLTLLLVVLQPLNPPLVRKMLDLEV